MTDHAQALARELGFLPHEEARQFPWSKRCTSLRILEVLLEADRQREKPVDPAKMRSVQFRFDDEKEWSG